MDQKSRPESVDFAMFRYTRIERLSDLPPADPGIVEVVLLDMNHGVPNLGHDSLVHAVHESARPVGNELDLSVRVLSFDVRRSHAIPPWDPRRFGLFIGTGGPGHLDPRLNTGVEEWCEGITEAPDWEAPLFDLFRRIRNDERTALFGFCHSFGLICRWAGVATPVLRGPEKGKSHGIVGYRLTEAAKRHPWFSKFGSELIDSPNFRVLDSRLFDLVPVDSLDDATVLATEHGSDEVATMVEIARDADGVMPRILGANHHPEVVDLHHMEEVLDEKLARGEITKQWHEERGASLRAFWREIDTDQRMRRTSRYTLLEPLRFYIRKAMLARREREVPVH